jgi:predicted DNA-binding WGR domain protein
MLFFTRIDPAQNISRFYMVRVTPTLFGEWSLLREWGRIGSPGTVQSRSFECEEDARRAEQRSIRRRMRHGYQPTQDVVSRWREVLATRASIKGAVARQKIESKWSRYLELTEHGVLDLADTYKNFT